MDAALTYIHIRFKESPTLGEVAAHVHYNPSYFSQLFKTYTGVKYVDYLNALKIDHAKRLLSFTDHSIIDIGFLCGFNSTSNFYLSFKKSTGVPWSILRTNRTNTTKYNLIKNAEQIICSAFLFV